MRELFSRLGGGLSDVGVALQSPAAFANLQAQREEQARQQENLRRVGQILSGQSIPEVLRPGGAEALSPQQFRQTQARQLADVGSPEALSALSQLSPISRQPLSAPGRIQADVEAGLIPQEVGKRLLEQQISSAGTGSAIERLAGRIQEAATAQGNPVDFITALSIAKSGLGQGVGLTPAGEVAPIAGVLGTRESIARATEAGRQQARLEAEPEIAARKTEAAESAKLRVAMRAAFPKVQASFNTAMDKNDIVLDKIKEVRPEVGAATAGFASISAAIPGTPAADLKANIDTILANLGFQELQEMRDNSPTGGALGQIAVREIELLQALSSNIQQSQSPDQLRKNLDDLERIVKGRRKRFTEAFNTQAELAGVDLPDVEKPSTEGITATDPRTGGKLILRGGQWQPLNP